MNPPTPGLLDISLQSMHRFPERIHEASEDEGDTGTPASEEADEEDNEDESASDAEERQRLLHTAQTATVPVSTESASARSVSPPDYHPIDPNVRHSLLAS